MSKNPKEIKIEEQDFQYIIGESYSFLMAKVLSNCFCMNCLDGKAHTITAYDIFIDSSHGIILRGLCKDCNGKMGRYLKTGEALEELGRILEIREKYN